MANPSSWRENCVFTWRVKRRSVCQSAEGFEIVGQEGKVYKLRKALYGLRQAPREWNVKLNQILVGLRFHRCSKEPSLYMREDKSSLLVVVVYVDDLLVTGSSLAAIEEFK